jgi:hypothetical protein
MSSLTSILRVAGFSSWLRVFDISKKKKDVPMGM